MDKFFWIPLLASFTTMFFLYLLGYIINSDILVFKISSSYTEVSLLPIIIGLFIGFITEWIIKLKKN